MPPVLPILALALFPAFASAATPPGGPAPAPAPVPASAACPAILQHRFPRLQDDAPQELCQYAGKVILVVNTASYCGFTPQYEGLEALHARFAPRGLVVIGFPSNDFGAQEPGGSKQIADFCFNTYGVKFPMMGKTVVKGPGRHPFYATLDKVSGQAPRWNFHKYLIGRDGQVLGSYASEIKPQDRVLVAAIERALRP